MQQTKQGPIAAGAGKLSLGNWLLANQSMGGYPAEVRAYAQALGATDRAFVEAVQKGRFGL